MWKQWGEYFYGEQEETEEQKQIRERRHAKLKLLSKNQRSALLEDLKSSMEELKQAIINRETVQQTATMESTDDSKGLVLNDDMPIVTKVCDYIDRCCCHGLRHVEGEEDQYVKLFGLLKWTCARLDAMQQQRMASGMDEAGSEQFSKEACQLATSSLAPKLSRDVRGFMACMRASNSLANVDTDEGKARAFIRQALNTHILQNCLRAIVAPNNQDLLMSYYTEFALFRQPEESIMFLSLLDGIDKYSFGFMIDDLRLDLPPESMPFAEPLPVPEPKEIKITPPALIDPEDMIDGRVRLASYDENNSLLAEKLVTHRHLGNNYDAPCHGNPLADILRKTQTSQAFDDAATAVLRFLEIGLPEYDVFGSPLINVVCNPFLCGMARFDTSMGLPDVVEACICFLHRKLTTPGIFQVHLAPEHVMDLRDAIEELGGFHKSMAIDPHEVVAILLQYLWELPDPLFTEDRWEAFVDCGKLQDPEERLSNLKNLVNDLPWSHKPLLERLIHLFGRALLPEFSQRSGVDAHMLALLLSPITLRGARRFRFSELDDASFRRFPIAGHTPIRQRFPASFYGEDSTEAERAAAEARALRMARRQAEEGAIVIQLLIENQDVVLADFRKEVGKRRALLKRKVDRMESIRHRLNTPIDLNNPTHVSLLKMLWDGLLPCPGDDENTILEDNNGTIDAQRILQSRRWKASGFHTENPMGGFRGGGLLSLECLAYFVHEYPEKAKGMMTRNSLPGGDRYPFPVACINVMRMMTTLLMVDEPPATPSRLILHSETGVDTILEMQVAERVSRTQFWRVFDDPKAFEKLHSMAFMLLDLHWTRSGATQMGFNPVLDSTRRQMGWLLEQAPKNIEEMWKTWMQAREQHAKAFSTPLPVYNDSIHHDTEDLVRQIDENLRLQQEKTREEPIVSPIKPNEVAETISTASTASASPTKDDSIEWNQHKQPINP